MLTARTRSQNNLERMKAASGTAGQTPQVASMAGCEKRRRAVRWVG